MALILPNQSVVLNAYAALSNQTPGNAALKEHSAYVSAFGEGAYKSALNNIFVSTPTAVLATNLLKNLGLGDVFTQAQAEAYLGASANRVGAMVDLASALFNYNGGDAKLGAAKSAYVSKVERSYEHSNNPANVNGVDLASGSTSGQSFTLTTGIDQYNGSSGADFIRGVAGSVVGNQDQPTLNSSDVLDGGAGEDLLALLLNGNYGGGATLKNIETLQIGTNLGGAAAVAREFDYNVNNGAYEINGVNTVVYDQITANETLTVTNITPTATGSVLPTLKWDNEAGSVAGTIAATFREAGVAGATTQLNVVLDDVNNGTINLGGKIETIKITSQGSSANTLANSINADGSPVVDLISASEDGVNNNGSLTKVIIDGAQNFGAVAGVVATAGANQGLTNRAVGADGGFVNETPVTGSNLISVAATVTEIDASAATGNVNVRFTPRVNGAEVNQVFKGGEGSDYVEFEVGNVNATGGKGNDTFAFLNNQFNSTFTTLDTIAGGEGSDTVQLGVNGRGVYNVDWTEFNNKTGVDTLDLRGAQNNVTLADSFVASADAGLTVRTDKIVQTSTSSVANPTGGSTAEDNAITTLNLTKLAANRALTFEGGSGSDRLIGNEASITSAAVLKGGTNVADNGGAQAIGGDYDTLTVVDSAVLSRGDLSNISGFEGLALVKTDNAAARTFSIELTEAFLLANTAATNSGATDINDTVFAITTGPAGGSNALTGVDRVSIDVTDLFNTTTGVYKTTLAGRTVDINGLIAAVGAANVTVVYNGTSTTLAAAPAAVQAAVTNLGTNSAQVNASAGLVAGSGGGSGAGAGGAAAPAAGGNTFTLTNGTSNLTTSSNTGTDRAGTNVFLDASANAIVGSVNVGAATIITDTTAGDGDSLSFTLSAAGPVAPAIAGIETLNVTSLAASGLNAALITGATTLTNAGTNVLTVTNLQQATNALGLNGNLGAGLNVTYAGADTNNFAGTLTLNGGTLVGSSLTVAGNDIDQLAIVSSGATANAVTISDAFNEANGGTAETITVTGTAALTIAGTTANLGTANSSTISATNTGGTTVNFTDAAGAGVTVSVAGYTGVTNYGIADTGGAFTVTGINGASSTFTLTGANVTTDTFSATTAGHVLNIVDGNATAADAFGITLGNANIATVNLTAAAGQTGTVTLTNFNQVGTQTFNLSGPATGTAGNFAVTLANQANGTLAFNGGTYAGNLTVTTTAANAAVVVTGGAGNDSITGTNNADVLSGGNGNDTLIGGQGIDQLTGGAGADRFQIAQALTANREVITDFTVAQGDIFSLSNGAFAGSAAAGTALVVTTAAGVANLATNIVVDTLAAIQAVNQANTRFAYDTTNGNLLFDANGNWTEGNEVVIANVTLTGTLTAANFEMIA